MITFRSNNTITVDFQLNDLHLAVDAHGRLTGSFRHPVSHRLDLLQGTILQKTNSGTGFYQETNSIGFLDVDPIVDTNAVLITPPAVLAGAVLTIAPTTSNGSMTTFTPRNFSFDATNVTADVTSFGTNSTYSYSSYSSSGVNIAELNLNGSTKEGARTIVQFELHFTSNTAGTFLGAITASGKGASAGNFTLTLP